MSKFFVKRKEIKALKQDIRKLKRATGGAELKFIDNDINSFTVTTALAVLATMFEIPRGTDEGERDGMRITLKRLHFKFIISLPTTTTVADSSDLVRLIIWKDKQANGVLPSGTDNLLTNGTAGINHHYNEDQSSRNVILWDRVFALNASAGGGSTTTYSPVNKQITYNRKVNVPMLYNNSVSTGAIASIESNNIYLSTVSLNGKATCKVDLRVWYSDP